MKNHSLVSDSLNRTRTIPNTILMWEQPYMNDEYLVRSVTQYHNIRSNEPLINTLWKHSCRKRRRHIINHLPSKSFSTYTSTHSFIHFSHPLAKPTQSIFFLYVGKKQIRSFTNKSSRSVCMYMCVRRWMCMWKYGNITCGVLGMREIRRYKKNHPSYFFFGMFIC